MSEPEQNIGGAGQSALRKAENLRKRRQEAHAKRPAVVNALLGPSARENKLAHQETHWRTGARGEELLGEYLASKCPAAVVLHDRRRPGTSANIDHVAVCASGVYVIDAKRYRGKITVRTPIFGEPTLTIAGRDRTKLVDGLEKQVAAVAPLAREFGDAPVNGCLCFIAPDGFLADVGLPAFRTLSIRGYKLYYLKRLAKCLNADGPLAPDAVAEVSAGLDAALRKA